MKNLPRLLLLLACLHALALESQAQPLRHLFLDPSFLEQSENAALHVNPAQQREVVIRTDKPWEQLMISLFLTVLDDGGKLRMWYICRDKNNVPNVAYAESTDGVNWIKPNLGIVEYEGSKDNNLVGLSSLEGTVFRDERAPAEQRYCYITHLLEKEGGMVRFHSPDGLRWTRDAEPLLKFGADSQAVTFWDERVGKYALYLRGWEQRADSYLYRTVVRVDLPNLTSPVAVLPTEQSRRLWGKENPAVIDTEFPKVLATDETDSFNSDVYTISAQPYPLDPRWYVGFPSFFQRIDARKKGRLDVQFIGSRDGFQWHRYDRTSYVSPGIVGSGSEGMVFMGPHLVVRGDELWQYGTAFRSIHGDIESRKDKADGIIYRYVQRVDGFVSLDFDARGGRAVTAPVKVDGPELALNVDTAVLGHLRVGLADSEGKTIKDFDSEDCEILRINSTRAAVKWKGGSDLTSLKGRDVRLIFTGSRAKLYSFYFTAESN
jgi:hypothetical protein